jgi:hypothetical protein
VTEDESPNEAAAAEVEAERKYRTFGGMEERLAAYIKRMRLEASARRELSSVVYDPEKHDTCGGYRKI